MFEAATVDKVQGAKSALHAAQAVYSGTPKTDRGLRDIVLRAVNDYLKEVIDQDEDSQFILKEVPDLVCFARSAAALSMYVETRCSLPTKSIL